MRPYEDIAKALRAKHIMTSWKEVLAIPGDRQAGAEKDALASRGSGAARVASPVRQLPLARPRARSRAGSPRRNRRPRNHKKVERCLSR
jgi:hypothetical protein